MKNTILISLLCLASIGALAQTKGHCKVDPKMPANAEPAWPTTAYTPLQDPTCPPCYTYTKKNGLTVMECHYLRFPAEHAVGTTQPTARAMWDQSSTNLDVQSRNTYMGNYPKHCKRSPNMPANAVPAWPKSEYTALQDPSCAPCYTYKNKRGLEIMECHYLRFPAENKDN